MDAPHVLLACSGLDHARRGFESFARECFDVLRDEPGLRIELVKGSGPSAEGERAIPAVRRDQAPVRALARALRARPFRVEHVAFGFGLQPLLARRRPDVVYLSEWDTARVLARWRGVTRQPFKLLLSNGTFVADGFEHLDRVQELTPAGLEYVLARGADPRRHSLLPLGFRIEPELRMLSAEQRSALRARLGLPQSRAIVVSVAALNRRHKRLDYVIEEVAALPAPRPFVLLVGEPDAETPGLALLARRRLGPEGYEMRTVLPAQVPDLLRASDVFVLASAIEAQARSLIEAMSYGLPCLAHDSPITRFALGDHGLFADLLTRGALAQLLRAQLDADPPATQARAHAGHQHVYERFSWARLRPRYVELLGEVARGSANSTVSSSRAEKLSR